MSGSKKEVGIHRAYGNGRVQFFKAVESAGMEELKSALDGQGQPILHRVAGANDPSACQALVKRGVPVDLEDRQQWTPLMVACAATAVDSILYLLTAQANVHGTAAASSSPLHYFVRYVSQIFQKPDQRYEVALARAMSAIQALLAAGADVNSVNNNGETPLHAASFSGVPDLVQFFADRAVDVNAQSNSGETPLHHACRRGDVDSVRVLVLAGGNRRIKGLFGSCTSVVKKSFPPGSVRSELLSVLRANSLTTSLSSRHLTPQLSRKTHTEPMLGGNVTLHLPAAAPERRSSLTSSTARTPAGSGAGGVPLLPRSSTSSSGKHSAMPSRSSQASGEDLRSPTGSARQSRRAAEIVSAESGDEGGLTSSSLEDSVRTSVTDDDDIRTLSAEGSVIVFGMTCGACSECDCRMYECTEGTRGGPCRECGHFPQLHQQRGSGAEELLLSTPEESIRDQVAKAIELRKVQSAGLLGHSAEEPSDRVVADPPSRLVMTSGRLPVRVQSIEGNPEEPTPEASRAVRDGKNSSTPSSSLTSSQVQLHASSPIPPQEPNSSVPLKTSNSASLPFLPPSKSISPDRGGKKSERRKHKKKKVKEPKPELVALLVDCEYALDAKDVQLGSKLGVGTSSKVYRGAFEGRDVAVKVLAEGLAAEQLRDVAKELAIHSSLDHPNIVRFYGVYLDPRFCIVLEYCSRGSLYHVLNARRVDVTWPLFFDLMRQLLAGISYLHSRSPPVVHRDLKSLNVLLTDSMQLKICDFGLSRASSDENLTTLGRLRGTMAYTAPEVYLGSIYSMSSDVYALGIIMWEFVARLLTGSYQRPYAEFTQLQFDFQVIIKSAKFGWRPSFVQGTPDPLRLLISQCWHADADQRPPVDDIARQITRIEEAYLKDSEPGSSLLQ